MAYIAIGGQKNVGLGGSGDPAIIEELPDKRREFSLTREVLRGRGWLELPVARRQFESFRLVAGRMVVLDIVAGSTQVLLVITLCKSTLLPSTKRLKVLLPIITARTAGVTRDLLNHSAAAKSCGWAGWLI